MRIYLAGPSAEIERVKEAAAAIEERGHTITERWWEHVERMREAGYATDADVPLAELRAGLDANRRGIRISEAVVAMAYERGGLRPARTLLDAERVVAPAPRQPQQR